MISAEIQDDNSIRVEINGDLNTILYELINTIDSLIDKISFEDIGYYLKRIDDCEVETGYRAKGTEELIKFLLDYKNKFLKENDNET